jgi:hypothetical protein
MLPVVQIHPTDDLAPLVRPMRRVAWEAGVETRPDAGYSSTEGWERVARRDIPQAKALLDRGDVRIVQLLPDHALVSVSLSVEVAGDKGLRWHLSVGGIPATVGQPPSRVSDTTAVRLASAFGAFSEGPPKGIFVNVRHFYGLCQESDR